MITFKKIRQLFSSHEISEDDITGDALWNTTASGGVLTEELLLSIPAAYDAINAILNPIKTLPLIFYRQISEKEKKRISPDEVGINLQNPNEFQNQVEFFDFMGRNLLIYHNAFAEFISDNAGNILGYIPFHPDNVSVVKHTTGFAYRVQNEMNVRFIPPDRMWHIKSGPYDKDGLMGRGPIVTHQETLSAAREVRAYGARFFKNDAQPGGVIQVKGKINAEGARNLSKTWRQAQGGKNKHRTAVLEEGSEYKQFDIQNDKAQFLETRKEDVIDIARIWNVPPHRIKALQDATYSNIEQQSTENTVHSLEPWFTLIETSIKSNLIGLDNNIFAEYNVLGLLRGDIKARYEAYAKARNWGWLSVNDIRVLESMNPIGDEGDIYLMPLNTRDASDEPPEENNSQNADKTLKLIKGTKDA